MRQGQSKARGERMPAHRRDRRDREREQLVKHGIQIVVEKVRVLHGLEQIETIREKFAVRRRSRHQRRTLGRVLRLDPCIPLLSHVAQGRQQAALNERMCEPVIRCLLGQQVQDPNTLVPLKLRAHERRAVPRVVHLGLGSARTICNCTYTRPVRSAYKAPSRGGGTKERHGQKGGDAMVNQAARRRLGLQRCTCVHNVD